MGQDLVVRTIPPLPDVDQGRTGLKWCHLPVTTWKCVKTLLFYYTAEYILKTSLAVQTPTEG